MQNIIFTVITFLLFQFLLQAQQGDCFDCMVSLPSLPEDTIYISAMPNGSVGQGYEESMSFRMPKTTTPVNAIDPGTPAGLNINQIELLAVNNVPPGLVWDTEQTVFSPDEETDGCIAFCGTPLVAGTYDVEILISANVAILTETAAFTFPIVIEPAMASNDGFGLVNNVACGSAEVGIQNNIPSNGHAGITYFWDFGNGNTTTAENPPNQAYSEPGVYSVDYQVVIDTVGFILTNIEVKEASCDDLPGFPTFSTAPDMHIKVIAPNGDTIFQTPSYDNTFAPIESSCYIRLGEGNYQVEVIDDDSGLNFGDDECGTVTFNKYTIGDLFDGDLTIGLTIIHPVDTITATDSVVVYESPAIPQNIALSSTDICDGTGVVLETNYAENIQWYRDSVAIVGAIESTYEATEDGMYFVRYENAVGCQAFSEMIEVVLLTLPATPAYVNNDNILSVFDLEALPTDYSLVWYEDGAVIEDENGTSLCIENFGTYTLEVTDEDTGCTSSFTTVAAYNPNVPCHITSLEVLSQQRLNIFPNPFATSFAIEWPDFPDQLATIQIWDVSGRLIHQEISDLTTFQQIDAQNWSSGIYVVEVVLEEGVVRKRLVKQ